MENSVECIFILLNFVEPRFAKITISSHLGGVSTSVAKLETEILGYSSQNYSDSMRFDAKHLETDIFKPC